jgi:hypothetical protein
MPAKIAPIMAAMPIFAENQQRRRHRARETIKGALWVESFSIRGCMRRPTCGAIKIMNTANVTAPTMGTLK